MSTESFLGTKVTAGLAVVLLSAASWAQHAEWYNAVRVHIGADASPVERKVAQLLADRLAEPTGLTTSVDESDALTTKHGEMVVLFGVSDRNEVIGELLETERIAPLTELAPGPEGFLLQHFDGAEMTGPMSPGDTEFIVAAGIDERGCLYATGELLRHTEWSAKGVKFPSLSAVRAAPAFEFRGTQFGQSHIAKSVAQVRPWTEEETHRVILDYALAGANTFSTNPQWVPFLRSYGLMAETDFGPNVGSHPDHPEWEAAESIGRLGYVCLSIPEARAFMLKKCEDEFKDAPFYDLIKFKGGDGGGCECDKCDPYGKPFIEFSAELAGVIHKYHPDTKIYFTNQKFDNADDEAVFDYLEEEPREWLWAFGYGPGSDATTWQPGHRQTHRMDLFRYPGYGPYRLYPKEILHRLPPQQVLMYFNEITHWKYAQHAFVQMYPRADREGNLPPHWSHEIYERFPDQALTMVYNRLSFYACPRYYHRVFNDVMPYAVGDITHSSGRHDHFNQWMWMRLLFNPRMTVEEVTDEYARTWFGPEAGPEMAEAIFQLEYNLQEHEGGIAANDGIRKYYDLVKSAGAKMPGHWMKTNAMWRMYMQKGSLDLHTQLAVQQQKALEAAVVAMVKNGGNDETIARALERFDALEPSDEMSALREEARVLGEESNALFGDRNDGYFTLDHDFVGLGWLKRQLERAQAASGAERSDLLAMIANYTYPPGTVQYDNFGSFGDAPNAVFGYPYDHGQPYVDGMLDEGNRLSQRSMHYTQDEDQGVTIDYRNLDPDAEYKIRFTFVRPWFQERYAMRMNQKSQTIHADDQVLAADVELPLQMSDFFTYDIPKELTEDGTLTIRLERAADVARGDRVSREQWRNSGGWGTMVSEAWLIKK